MRALRDFRLLAKESKRRNREIEERVDQQTRQLEAKLTAEFTVSVSLPMGYWVMPLHSKPQKRTLVRINLNSVSNVCRLKSLQTSALLSIWGLITVECPGSCVGNQNHPWRISKPQQ